MLLGLCGRAGAGKTTFAKYLTNSQTIEPLYYIESDPLDYIVQVLFGSFSGYDTDPIWGFSYSQAKKLIIKLLSTYIDDRVPLFWNVKIPKTFVELPTEKQKWIEQSLADPLKKIAAVIFGIPYEILLGATYTNRKIRESARTIKFNKCGSLTGRECLEYLGTDVFRNHFDNNIWIKIFYRNSKKLLDAGINVILSDVRFHNEFLAVKKLSGRLVVIYREDKDLILTEEDKKTHPSKWKFLEFYQNAIKIKNNNTFKDFYFRIDSFINTF